MMLWLFYACVFLFWQILQLLTLTLLELATSIEPEESAYMCSSILLADHLQVSNLDIPKNDNGKF